MKISIAGLHIEVGEALREHCEERMTGLKTYFTQLIEVDVSLRKEHHLDKAEITVYASGINLRAVGEGADFYAAIDEAALKLERQLKRYKGRLQKHRSRRQNSTERLEKLNAQVYQMTEHKIEEDALDNAPEDMFAEYQPEIVRKNVRNIEPLTVDEAVMQMDLMHKNFFMFQNPKTGELNVVSREDDGTVRWIEPSLAEPKASCCAVK